jgi:3'(2'), 5'-bisphosphate nucleotidase
MSFLKDKVNNKLDQLLELTLSAGSIINNYRKNGFKIFTKSDGTPVTEADIASDKLIFESLHKITPDIVVVSEEMYEKNPSDYDNIPDVFWCVDPLDGTKNFINNEEEYTVNIALIENSKAIFGILYVPAKSRLYYTEDSSSYKVIEGIKSQLQPSTVFDRLNIVTSKRTHDETVKKLAEFYNPEDVGYGCKRMASSEKFCYVADSPFNIFPCKLGSKEWDTASGQAILEAVGGRVMTSDGKDLYYGKNNFVNNHFIAVSNEMICHSPSFRKLLQLL